MRLPVALAALLVAVALLPACDGSGETASPTTSRSQTPSSSATASPSRVGTPEPTDPPSPSPTPDVRPIPPAWALPIRDDIEPDALRDEALVPPGAAMTARETLGGAGETLDAVAVAYAIGDDPFDSEHGLAVWQRFAEPPAWSVVQAFVDPPNEGVLGIRLETGDLTSDGVPDLLSFEDRGGSGACGRWRVIAHVPGDADEVFRRSTCDTRISIVAGDLEVRAAVYEPGDPHCCPSAFRTTTLRWNGTRFARVASRTEPAA